MPWRSNLVLLVLARWVIPLSLGVLLFSAPLVSPTQSEYVPRWLVAGATFVAGIATVAMSIRRLRIGATAIVLLACTLRAVAFITNALFGTLPVLSVWRILYGGYVWVVLGLLVVSLFLTLEYVDPAPHPVLFPDPRPKGQT